MAELDRVREEIAYLKYWQGIFVVTDISLIGWLLSGSGEVTRPSILAFIAVVMLSFPYLGSAPANRTAHKADRDTVMIETLATIAMVIFVLVILGIGLDAARRK